MKCIPIKSARGIPLGKYFEDSAHCFREDGGLNHHEPCDIAKGWMNILMPCNSTGWGLTAWGAASAERDVSQHVSLHSDSEKC